ncbi:MAG: bifunctional adenosylcobinamide hydrolase/alpha-ribazole phosphatase CbiS [Ignisphaera sp.]|nr:bifunctional adenosylcobinamide hydrolase/alpha-ribazole phosphatase CbiS [Ignisphaera sp.]MCX8168210.1 bifunctional adenosylcobinamide hydrolase/alpha-ribazole phosphatase CbiS [Ignisphaera sp.]MDW8084920.1 bifunctional adenosylcobinamide hydrolase/alpha-ribazole phosphatase CbiS [Ignisphaera sp.]
MYLNIRRIDRDTIVIDFPKPVEIISTLKIASMHNSTSKSVKHAVFKHVESSFNRNDILEYYKEILSALNIDSAVVFLTAVSMDELLHLEGHLSEIVMTIGLEPPICINHSALYEPLKVGTINILVYVDAPLSKEAMIDLLKTVVEAKTAASCDLLLRCRSRAVGTVTDAIAVSRPLNSDGEILFSGMITPIGNSVARMIYSTIVSAGIRNGIEWLLRNCTGYSIDDLLTLFKNIYALAPVPGVPLEKAVEKARRILYKILEDPNVWSFIIAARELDIHGSSGTIPSLTTTEYNNDTVRVLADELIGISLALYVGGAKAMFSMYWIESLKKLGRLKYDDAGLYTDDVLSALLGSLYTLLFNKINEGDTDE